MNLNDNIEFLSLRLQTNPDSYLFARLADYLLSNGEVNRAIEICENGLKKHPYYVSAHFVIDPSRCIGFRGFHGRPRSLGLPAQIFEIESMPL